MRHGDQFDIERPGLEAAADGNDRHRDFRRTRLARAFGGEQRRRERRGKDRHLELGPELKHRAVMILMRVREHEADEVFAFLHQITDVGQDQIDAGQMIFRGKRNAEIDREP